MSNPGIHDTQIIQKIFTGHRTSTPAMGLTPLQATVVSATATTVTVTVDNFSDTATFTALYQPHWYWNGASNVQATPPTGTKCIICFIQNSLNPWVLAFTGWPTS